MRKIIHVDMDCFYAAIEMRDNPRLHGIPLAIGGSADRRGVISTATILPAATAYTAPWRRRRCCVCALSLSSCRGVWRYTKPPRA